jgi:hypothetical protein
MVRKTELLYGGPRVGEGEITRLRDPAIPHPFSKSAYSLKPLAAASGGREIPERCQPHGWQVEDRLL